MGIRGNWLRSSVVAVLEDGGPVGVARPAVAIEGRPALFPEALDRAPPAPAEAMIPLYAAALLKVAVELRRESAGSLDALLARVLDGTPVDRDAFRGYLQRNFSLIRHT